NPSLIETGNRLAVRASGEQRKNGSRRGIPERLHPAVPEHELHDPRVVTAKDGRRIKGIIGNADREGGRRTGRAGNGPAAVGIVHREVGLPLAELRDRDMLLPDEERIAQAVGDVREPHPLLLSVERAVEDRWELARLLGIALITVAKRVVATGPPEAAIH